MNLAILSFFHTNLHWTLPKNIHYINQYFINNFEILYYFKKQRYRIVTLDFTPFSIAGKKSYLGIFCLLGKYYSIPWDILFAGEIPYLGIFCLLGNYHTLVYFVCWENTVPWYILADMKIWQHCFVHVQGDWSICWVLKKIYFGNIFCCVFSNMVKTA